MNSLSNYIYISNPFIYFFITFITSGFLLTVPLTTIVSTRLSSFYIFVMFIYSQFLVVLVVFSKSLLYVLFLYELLFYPSLFILSKLSPNHRIWATIYYFTVWTQSGSILLIITTLSLYNSLSISYNFPEIQPNLSNIQSLMLFFGLGVKIPIWPFHFWLTKTHVEAPTFFSVYLSGFLVKTALLAFTLWLKYINSVSLVFFIVICMLGVIDSTLKFIVQVDLKKLVAYTTIQEMNIILLLLILSTYGQLYSFYLFIIVHTLLSSIFFLIVDVVYRSFKSRSIFNLSGLFILNTILSLYIIICVGLFTGLPYTSKFYAELNFFSLLLNYEWLTGFMVVISLVFLGNFFFTKVWLGLLFGYPRYFYINICSIKNTIMFNLYIFIMIFLAYLY